MALVWLDGIDEQFNNVVSVAIAGSGIRRRESRNAKIR
jgi:hypothetical protein